MPTTGTMHLLPDGYKVAEGYRFEKVYMSVHIGWIRTSCLENIRRKCTRKASMIGGRPHAISPRFQQQPKEEPIRVETTLSAPHFLPTISASDFPSNSPTLASLQYTYGIDGRKAKYFTLLIRTGEMET